MQWARADLEEKRSAVTLPMRGEHKPDSAALIAWGDPVVSGVTIGVNKHAIAFLVLNNSRQLSLPLEKNKNPSHDGARIMLVNPLRTRQK